MSWGDELVIIRRFLRDPNGNIWSDAFLLHMWNDVQQDVQNKTSVLEDVSVQRVPDLFHFSYMHEWEYRYIPTKYTEFYQCLNRHDEHTFCHIWETQQVAGISADVTDYGVHFTQPWEAYMGMVAGEVVRMKFPKNFRNVKFMAYDESPIDHASKKLIQSHDPSHMTREGDAQYYYPVDDLDKSYVLYPKPSAAFADDLSGEGPAFFIDGDTEDTDLGTIAVRTGSDESSNIGASVDIVGVTDNVFMVFDVNPTDMETLSDEPTFPRFMRKYVRYGVLARAFMANTDGRIKSLADLWSSRYALGINVLKRYMRNRSTDRDYRLTTKGVTGRISRRHPRLPSTYPAVNP